MSIKEYVGRITVGELIVSFLSVSFSALALPRLHIENIVRTLKITTTTDQNCIVTTCYLIDVNLVI